MGNLLSFPLLCLQNYAAFRFVFPASKPVKINGDDIVFRSSMREFEDWSRLVTSVGLRLSVGKTMVNSRFFTVNSHFFRARRRSKPACIPVLRSSGLSKPVTSFGGIGGAFRSFCRGFKGEARIRAETLFLTRRAVPIRETGRSLFRDLRIPASVESVQRSGLWRRECWYGETTREIELPPDPSRLQWTNVPEGWRRVPGPSRPSRSYLRRAREISKAFVRELVHQAWTGGATAGVRVEDYLAHVSHTGYEYRYREWCEWRKRPKRLFRGIPQPRTHGSAVVRKWLEEGFPVVHPRTGVGFRLDTKRVWVPEGKEESSERAEESAD